ncbi:accessory regulator protein B [Clostridium homopropionicum DSM 5847]|uniref:Accessory regulator protein B n=1 Tax=Clostridium homopropionicum DSM 5847 TaxID=1121318 RepID=A0A0L6ZB67_9CLOT|nr:accessory gene regulator B family protein [Clostridium homopropionicum]KOA20197.1 accessory regulator protein B [Clostridium homopropionicum DSM 5847]SFG59539.1 accessory gene regulator B [Clostridium homopropionicum]
MNNLSHSIANKIASELKLDNDKKEVIAYGTFALLQTFLSIFSVSVIGYLFHVSFEATIVLFTASILRKYSGGAHANSPWKCTFIGLIICIGQAILIYNLVNSFIDLNMTIIIILSTFLWAYIIIYMLAPVDSLAKPIKKDEKKKRMKKGSLVILSIYLIITICTIMLYIFFAKKIFLVYALCISGGIDWQVFTLTRSGHFTLRKLDDFLNYIIR